MVLVVALPPMAKVERKVTTKKVQPGRRRKRVRIYTAWHPVLVVLLEHVLPEGFYQCLSEFQLARELLRIDVVIVRRRRPGTPPAPCLLTSVVGDLADHTNALQEHIEQLRHPLPGQKRRLMKDESKVVESFEEALQRLLARLPPEQRLAGLAPEQRLAGLTEAQAVLALPDAMLRGLSNEYLATLPRETRAAIQRRLKRTAPTPRQPDRGRKSR